jgi:hypothetical protein
MSLSYGEKIKILTDTKLVNTKKFRKIMTNKNNSLFPFNNDDWLFVCIFKTHLRRVLYKIGNNTLNRLVVINIFQLCGDIMLEYSRTGNLTCLINYNSIKEKIKEEELRFKADLDITDKNKIIFNEFIKGSLKNNSPVSKSYYNDELFERNTIPLIMGFINPLPFVINVFK